MRRRPVNHFSQSPIVSLLPPSYKTGNTAASEPSTSLTESQSASMAMPGVSVGLAACDRTNEFRAAAKVLEGRLGNGIIAGRSADPRLRQRSRFSQIARTIGHDLANTYEKLERLTELARKKLLFDDKAMEITELTHIIKNDVKSLYKQIEELQKLSKDGSSNGRQIFTHSSNVVLSLESGLANVSSQFKNVLDIRTQNMREQKSRREQYGERTQSSVSHFAVPRHGSSVLLADENAAQEVAIDMSGSRTQQQQLLLREDTDTYCQARVDSMQHIESTIVELGGIFTQLAHMVKEQEEMVHRIDSNVEQAHMSVEAAQSEILKYFQSVSSNRWLMLKVVGVLLFFFVIFVVFMA